MLISSFQEGQHDSLVNVGDTTPAAFKAVLRYAYTDELACDDETVVDVMRKAREVQLGHLLSLCMRYCHANLAPPNAIPWLVQAEEHQLGELRVLTLAYVKRSIRRIRMAVAPWRRLSQSWESWPIQRSRREAERS